MRDCTRKWTQKCSKSVNVISIIQANSCARDLKRTNVDCLQIDKWTFKEQVKVISFPLTHVYKIANRVVSYQTEGRWTVFFHYCIILIHNTRLNFPTANLPELRVNLQNINLVFQDRITHMNKRTSELALLCYIEADDVLSSVSSHVPLLSCK